MVEGCDGPADLGLAFARIVNHIGKLLRLFRLASLSRIAQQALEL